LDSRRDHVGAVRVMRIAGPSCNAANSFGKFGTPRSTGSIPYASAKKKQPLPAMNINAKTCHGELAGAAAFLALAPSRDAGAVFDSHSLKGRKGRKRVRDKRKNKNKNKKKKEKKQKGANITQPPQTPPPPLPCSNPDREQPCVPAATMRTKLQAAAQVVAER